jgi:hypothetical protein
LLTTTTTTTASATATCTNFSIRVSSGAMRDYHIGHQTNFLGDGGNGLVISAPRGAVQYSINDARQLVANTEPNAGSTGAVVNVWSRIRYPSDATPIVFGSTASTFALECAVEPSSGALSCSALGAVPGFEWCQNFENPVSSYHLFLYSDGLHPNCLSASLEAVCVV